MEKIKKAITIKGVIDLSENRINPITVTRTIIPIS
jgi:hypothetical protein